MPVVRNGLAFAIAISLCWATLVLATKAIEWAEISGPGRLVIGLAADTIFGFLAYFIFIGDGRRRTWLVFWSVIVFGVLGVVFREPTNGFYALLTSLPYAAVAAVGASAAGRCVDSWRNRSARAKP